MFKIKEMMFKGLVDMGYAKAEWDEDVRIRRQQEAAAASGVLSDPMAVSSISYAGH